MFQLKPLLLVSLILLAYSDSLGTVAPGNINIGKDNTILSSGNIVKGDGNIVVPYGSTFDPFAGNPFFNSVAGTNAPVALSALPTTPTPMTNNGPIPSALIQTNSYVAQQAVPTQSAQVVQTPPIQMAVSTVPNSYQSTSDPQPNMIPQPGQQQIYQATPQQAPQSVPQSQPQQTQTITTPNNTPSPFQSTTVPTTLPPTNFIPMSSTLFSTQNSNSQLTLTPLTFASNAPVPTVSNAYLLPPPQLLRTDSPSTAVPTSSPTPVKVTQSTPTPQPTSDMMKHHESLHYAMVGLLLVCLTML